jgi:hypothetical protein
MSWIGIKKILCEELNSTMVLVKFMYILTILVIFFVLSTDEGCYKSISLC